MTINKDDIATKLKEKNATKGCHRCGHESFTILEGFSNIRLELDLTMVGFLIGGPTLPVVNIVCNNCGAITSHAIGALGMLSKETEKEGAV